MARRGSSRRTYVRDANGRFASTPGGGGPKRPATKAVKRGPNRLTRDNAGKITSQGGDGATVRGGRLKTAAGNLRGRQVAKLKTMQGVSYGKPVKKKQEKTTTELRRGEFYRGNFRPRNVTGKPQKTPATYGTDKDQNIETTISLAKNLKRFSVANLQKNKRATIASVSFPPPANTPNLNINTSNKWYKNPTKEQRELRRAGHLSTSDPRGVVFHEAAHAKYGHRGRQIWLGGRFNPFERIAKRVSKYASVNPNEFVAEVYAGRKTGRKYDHQVMSLFRSYTKSAYEKSSPLLLKNQKPRRRKRKP